MKDLFDTAGVTKTNFDKITRWTAFARAAMRIAKEHGGKAVRDIYEASQSTILLIGENDAMANIPATRRWFARLGTPDRFIKVYPHAAHTLDRGRHAGLGGFPAVALGCAAGLSGTCVRPTPHAAARHVPGSARSGVSAFDQFFRSVQRDQRPCFTFHI